MDSKRSEARRFTARAARVMRCGQRGQAMAEFALIVPLFLLVLFAIVDFGNAYSKYVTITNASREGARLGITGATSSAITTRTAQTADMSSDPNLTVAVSGAGGASGTDVTVTASYKYTFITPLAALIRLVPGGSGSIGSSITLTSKAVMRIE